MWSWGKYTTSNKKVRKQKKALQKGMEIAKRENRMPYVEAC
jgi:hypothetical protein